MFCPVFPLELRLDPVTFFFTFLSVTFLWLLFCDFLSCFRDFFFVLWLFPVICPVTFSGRFVLWRFRDLFLRFFSWPFETFVLLHFHMSFVLWLFHEFVCNCSVIFCAKIVFDVLSHYFFLALSSDFFFHGILSVTFYWHFVQLLFCYFLSCDFFPLLFVLCGFVFSSLYIYW